MPDLSVLDVLLHEEQIGTLTLIQGSRTLFTFNKAYVDNLDRHTLSLSFKDQFGQLRTDIPPTNLRVPPFFANLLPEGPLREYLANRAGVDEKRELFLLSVLGQDLPGALTIRPADGEALPFSADKRAGEARNKRWSDVLRFSLAGVQEVLGGEEGRKERPDYPCRRRRRLLDRQAPVRPLPRRA